MSENKAENKVETTITLFNLNGDIVGKIHGPLKVKIYEHLLEVMYLDDFDKLKKVRTTLPYHIESVQDKPKDIDNYVSQQAKEDFAQRSGY